VAGTSAGKQRQFAPESLRRSRAPGPQSPFELRRNSARKRRLLLKESPKSFVGWRLAIPA